MDYWSLVQSIEKKNLECEVRYVGIDEIDWNYKFDKRDGDELYFKKGNAINFFEENKEFILQRESHYIIYEFVHTIFCF